MKIQLHSICLTLFTAQTTTLSPQNYNLLIQPNNQNQTYSIQKSEALQTNALNFRGSLAIGDFNEPSYRPSFFNKVVKLPKTLSLKNQFKLNECYLYAYVHFVEHAMLHTRGLQSAVPISAEYLFARKMYEIVERKIQGYRSDLFFEGGHFYDAIYLTEKYGLVPESVWRPRLSVHHFDYSFLAKFMDDPKTLAASEFSRDIKELQSLRSQFRPDSEIQDFIQQLRQKYISPLDEMFGPLPTEFTINGRTYTPREYAEEFDISSYTKIHVRFPYDKTDMNLYNESKSRFKAHLKNQVPVTHEIANLQTLTEFWAKSIDQNNPTFVNIHWLNSRHGLVIVGYERSRLSGEIVRFKVQNSWGENWSSDGYAWYTPQDIYQNLINAISIESSTIKHQNESSTGSAADFFNF